MSPILLSAETHNFPSGVAPLPRRRRARRPHLPPRGYSVGALNIPPILSVGSKRFLTSKVDRCCGPLHLPLSDVAVFAQSPFSTTGCATAIGEQPVKGLIDPAAMGRSTVGEACTNLVWAAITDIEDVNKLEGEARDVRLLRGHGQGDAGAGRRGGRRQGASSMAAKVGEEVVKAPGTLVVSVYAGVRTSR
ncbi:hypothetical protein WA556_005350 [Blastocystis sp. ATCC 50177/Nand II]